MGNELNTKLNKEEIDILKARYERYNKMCDLYLNNKEFAAFVDKTCKNYGLHKDVALLHKTVQEVGEYYATKDDGKLDICPCGREDIELEDKSC